MAEEKMRLYEVEITFRVMVAAESDSDAIDVFRDDRHSITGDAEPDVDAAPARGVLDGWAGSIPYSALDRDHPRRDWTVDQWLDATREADAQAKREAEFAARQVPLPLPID